MRLHRSVFYYRSVKNPRLELRQRMRELARTRVRYGYRRLHVLLKREGWSLGRNQAYRLYCEEGLQLRSKLPRRRKMAVVRRERFLPHRVNQAWSMDFVSDQLVDGRRIRALTIVDVFSREAIAIEVGQRLRAENVVDVCKRLVARRGKPKRVFVDNGSEFSGRMFDLWAYHHGVQIDFSRPGKPMDKLLHRNLQRVAARRVLECSLVQHIGGGQSEDRDLAERLQREPTSPGAPGANAR